MRTAEAEATRRCTHCGLIVPGDFIKCPECHNSTYTPKFTAEETPANWGRVFGALIFLGGTATLVWCLYFFETSVPTAYGPVNNLGLMNERQMWTIAAVGSEIVGVLLMLFSKPAAS